MTLSYYEILAEPYLDYTHSRRITPWTWLRWDDLTEADQAEYTLRALAGMGR